MTVLAVSFIIATVLGFTAHRASLCTVRAVGEILHTRRARILASFAKAALWAVAVSLPLRWLHDLNMMPTYPLRAVTLLGGFLFGLGAAVNGGCTFSTLGRLAEGDLSYLGAIGGFVAGAAAASRVVGSPDALVVSPPAATAPGVVLVGLVWVWGAWQATRLWRSRSRHGPWITAERYRLSTSAIILGVGGGTMVTLHGSWTYTAALRDVARLRPATALQAGIAAALFLGMLLSARLRGASRLRRPGALAGTRRFAGGLLMGAGSALLPGGNAALVLVGIPSLSPHAIPAYGMILIGVAIPLVLTGNPAKVRCNGDVCPISIPGR